MDNLSILEQIITAPQPTETERIPPVSSPVEIKEDGVKTETHVETEPKKEVKPVEGKESKPQLREWFWTNLPESEPLFAVCRDALGIIPSREGTQDSNLIAEVAASAATLLQTDNEKKIFEFLRKELTSTPANVGNPLYFLRRNLIFKLKEQKAKWRGGGKR